MHVRRMAISVGFLVVSAACGETSQENVNPWYVLNGRYAGEWTLVGCSESGFDAPPSLEFEVESAAVAGERPPDRVEIPKGRCGAGVARLFGLDTEYWIDGDAPELMWFHVTSDAVKSLLPRGGFSVLLAPDADEPEGPGAGDELAVYFVTAEEPERAVGPCTYERKQSR